MPRFRINIEPGRLTVFPECAYRWQVDEWRSITPIDRPMYLCNKSGFGSSVDDCVEQAHRFIEGHRTIYVKE
jgi:hypothetical protein